MNYFFTPYALVEQYQPFYSFVPQMLVRTDSYYHEIPQLQK